MFGDIGLQDAVDILLPITDTETVYGGGTHWALLHLHIDKSGNSALLYNSAVGCREVYEHAKQILVKMKLLLNIKSKLEVNEVKNYPQQSNGYDCGVYVMMAADAIVNKKEFKHPTNLRA